MQESCERTDGSGFQVLMGDLKPAALSLGKSLQLDPFLPMRPLHHRHLCAISSRP